MSTVEKALIQIFERKDRIIDHVKQQILLFDHQLASKCLIDGLVPPPWLLSASPSELNKEDLISGLLLPHPQPSIPYCSLYQQPVVTYDNVQLPQVLCSRVDGSNECLAQCLSGKADECDPSVTSPQDCRDGMISDICPEPGLSLARIQRSKSRQRALEHRNSAKVCKNIEGSEKTVVACSSQNNGSKIASLQFDSLDKLGLIRSGDNIVSCLVENEERGQCRSKEGSENIFSGRVTRSRSSIQPTKSVSGPSSTGNTSFVAKQDGMVLAESIINSCPQLDGVHELLEPNFVKPAHNTVSCAVKNEERGQCRSKERSENVFSGRVTRSRSSIQPSKSVSGPSSAGNTSFVAKQDGMVLAESIINSCPQFDGVHELLEPNFVKPAHNTVSCAVKNEERGQCRTKERSENVFSGRVTRSRSSIQPSKSVSGPSSAGNTSFIAKQDGMVLAESISKSHPQLDGVHELLEPNFVKPAYNTVSCAEKNEEWGQCQRKERNEDSYSGRTTRSRCSVQPSRSMNCPSSAGQSFSVAKRDGIVLTESIHKSRLLPDAAAELLQCIKPAHNVVTCVVAKEERGQRHSREGGENAFSGRITRSRSSVQSLKSVNELSYAGKASNVAKCDGNMNIESISESKQQSSVVDELLELVKPAVISDERFGSGKVRNERSKETENNVYQGRITRSSSSSQQHDCVNNHLKLDSFPDRSIHDGISKSIQQACHANDLKELIKPSYITDQSCGIEANTSDSKTKENAVVGQFNHGRTRSRVNHSADLFKLIDSSNTLEYEVPQSKPKASNKAPYAKSSDRSMGAELEAVSGTQVNSLLCYNDSDLADLNHCDAIAADRDADSDELLEAHSASSVSNLDGSNCPLANSLNRYERVEMEVKGRSPHSASAMILKPKLLNFDDMGESALNEASRLVPESEEMIKSLEKMPLTSLLSADKLVGETSVCYTDTYNLSLENQLSEEREAFSKEEKLSETDFSKTSGPGRTSNLNADIGMDYVFEKVPEVVKSVTQVPEASNVDVDECSGPGIAAYIYFTGVQSPALLRKTDVTFSDVIEHPCAALIEEIKDHSVKQKMSSASQNENPDSMGRCNADDIDSVLDQTHEKSSEHKVAIQSMQAGRRSSSNVGTSSHKRRKIDGQHSNFLSVSLTSKEEDVLHLNANESLVDEEDQNVGKCNWKEGDRNENTPSISSLPPENLEKFDHSAEKTAAVDPSGIMFASTRKSADDDKQISLNIGDKSDCGNIEHLACDERNKQDRKSQLPEDGEFSSCPISSPCRPPPDLISISADESRPELEGFIMQTNSEQICIGGDGISFDRLDLPKTTIERASLLEQLCKSASIHTPLSQFPAYSLHQTTELYRSVPNGLLECMELRSTLPENDDKRSQLKVSTSCFGYDPNHDFLRGYFSDCLPFPSYEVEGDVKKPYLSPVGKLWNRITSNSSSSEKHRSLNPELPRITEENENTDEVVDAFLQEGTALEVVTCSVRRKPLAEISECSNIPASDSGPEISAVRDSLDSVNTAFSFTGAENGIKQKVGKYNAGKRRDTNKLKENRSILPGANGTKRESESLRNRLTKPKLSEKTSLRNGGPSFSQKESKINNIVSNVTSFIPIVQQKQAASIITGKRDVNVKALEAAEAAKKLAEKKENDRKMKREALKIERARLQQENLRQMELEKRKKEEERKKKEADMAAKKRQREEEERLEKERKRKRMEEAWRQQRAPDEKLAKKDEKGKKCQAPDEKAQTRMKVPNVETVKHKKVQKEIAGGNDWKTSETESRTAVVSTSDAVKATTAIEDYNAKVMSTTDRATESDNLIANTSQEESYDISPYKGSDDEDEEEDDNDEMNRKFIPSWASKNRVALVVASQQNLDPEVIFPPESFCSIAQVLLPRKLQQNRAS